MDNCSTMMSNDDIALLYDIRVSFTMFNIETYQKANRCLDSEPVLVKEVGQHIDRRGVNETSLREVMLLHDLQHENIIKLLDVHVTPQKLVLVFESCASSLKQMFESRRYSPCATTVHIWLHQLLQAINFCHLSGIVHRDIIPSNIFLSPEGCLKLTGFDHSRFASSHPTNTSTCALLQYRAPEVMLGSTIHGNSIDIWAAACIFAEMTTLHPLFKGDCEIYQLFKIFCLLGTPKPEQHPSLTKLPCFKTYFPKWERSDLSQALPAISPLGIDLLEAMLCYEPEKRISALDALQHPFFASCCLQQSRSSIVTGRNGFGRLDVSTNNSVRAYTRLLDDIEVQSWIKRADRYITTLPEYRANSDLVVRGHESEFDSENEELNPIISDDTQGETTLDDEDEDEDADDGLIRERDSLQ